MPEPTAAQRSALPVLLVSMPFMDADRPSIQLGLLQTVTRAYGFPVRTLHANLDFAARVGRDRYRRLCDLRGCLVGDWLFSVEAFGCEAPDPDAHLVDDLGEQLRHLGGAGAARRARLLRIRHDDVPAYLDALVTEVDWPQVRVVGFSSSFQQTAASVALARRLKQRFPHLITVFGGANLDGPMGVELVRTVGCVDLAVAGEADVAFPRLLQALASGSGPDVVPGVVRLTDAGVVATPPAPPLASLDQLPIPDYDEYFDRASALGLLTPAIRRRTWIPIETARGCWWGAKHHCTFCGLNQNTMQFRSKSAQRVRRELAHQARRYGSFRFAAVDNILDPEYLRTLIPSLDGDEGGDYEIFYEVKSNLTRPQLRSLAQAGVTHIQPGLESLSTPVLGLMRKGVTAAQNVNLLRWAGHYGIGVVWNLLWGFPGEQARHYADQAALVPHLWHLQPPDSADRVWLERFSPLYTDPGRYPLRWRRPERSYRYVYPSGVDLDRIAYFFDHEFVDALPDAAFDDLRRAVADWRRAWRSDPRPTLTYRHSPGYLQINDARHAGRDGTYTFDGLAADVYVACSDRPAGVEAVRERVGRTVAVEEVRDVLDEFQRCGLLYVDGPRSVALAVPAARRP